jgi:hypothetical protein
MASGLELIGRMWEEESWREFHPGEGRHPQPLFLRPKADLTGRKVPSQVSLRTFTEVQSSLSLS